MSRRDPNKPRVIKSGHCQVCNRPLRDPVSKERGVGPVCWKNQGGCSDISDVRSGSAPTTGKLFVDDLPPADIDVLYRYQGYHGCECHCQLRIWYGPAEPEMPTPALAIASELESNHGTSVTNMAEYLWASICNDYLLGMDGSVETYEHYSWDCDDTHFNRVRFAGPVRSVYNSHVREDRLKFGAPKWEPCISTDVMVERIREFQGSDISQAISDPVDPWAEAKASGPTPSYAAACAEWDDLRGGTNA